MTNDPPQTLDFEIEIVTAEHPPGVYIKFAGERIMRREGARWRWHKDVDGRNFLSAELEPLSLIQLTDMVAHHAVRFEKINSRGHRVDIDPPEVIMKPLHGAHHHILSDVKGIITSPTMRPDGSLLTEQGYDEQTELWYKSSDNVELPPIPERPTRNDADKALALLNGLLDEFPFEGETEKEKKSVSRSAALAAIITTAARGALFGAVPLFVMTAPKARTGKTYLIHVITTIATGHIPVSDAGSEDDTEFEKRVETAALAGRAIMHFNNLPENKVVKSVRLAELATEGMVNIRKLGRHEQGQCDCRATTAFLNGNNILMSGDLVPRTVSCRLIAKEEHPEERKFNSDPIRRVRANRGAYLAAVFTIIHAFRAAGSPQPAEGAMKRDAGFDQWSELVQQPLIWLGMADPLGAMEAMRAMDPEQEDLQRLYDALQACLTTEQERRHFTVAMCTDKANDTVGRGEFGPPKYKYPALRELMIVKGQINTRHFGRVLAGARDKIRDGWCIKVVETPGVRTAANAYCLIGPSQAGAGVTVTGVPDIDGQREPM